MMSDDKIDIENYEKYKNIEFPLVTEIEEHHVDNLTYNEFFDKFMVKNVPVLITGISDAWECMNWVNSGASSNDSSINFEYLKQKIDSNQNVPIANCSKVYFNSHEKFEMPFGQFVDYWKNQMQRKERDSTDLLYLKDWHLRHNQSDYKFYKTPVYFASDWLNEYCEEKRTDDYRFVYMGPKGTW